MSEEPIYKKVVYWVENYGKAGIPDDRAVQEFMICETHETVSSLRSEIIAIADGKFKNETLDVLVGVKRRIKHGSYDAWAKMMLLWLVSYKG